MRPIQITLMAGLALLMCACGPPKPSHAAMDIYLGEGRDWAAATPEHKTEAAHLLATAWGNTHGWDAQRVDDAAAYLSTCLDGRFQDQSDSDAQTHSVIDATTGCLIDHYESN